MMERLCVGGSGFADGVRISAGLLMLCFFAVVWVGPSIWGQICWLGRGVDVFWFVLGFVFLVS
jgi:hypothetical protein